MTIEEFLIKIKSLKENNTPIMLADFKTYVNLFNILYSIHLSLSKSKVNKLTLSNILKFYIIYFSN